MALERLASKCLEVALLAVAHKMHRVSDTGGVRAVLIWDLAVSWARGEMNASNEN